MDNLGLNRKYYCPIRFNRDTGKQYECNPECMLAYRLGDCLYCRIADFLDIADMEHVLPDIDVNVRLVQEDCEIFRVDAGNAPDQLDVCLHVPEEIDVDLSGGLSSDTEVRIKEV